MARNKNEVPAVPAVPAIVVAVKETMGIQLSQANVASFICDIGDAVEGIGKAYHYAMAWMIQEFTEKAVFGISGNKCKAEDSKKKHATELGLDYSKFQQLYAIFETINRRRPDSWRQAKNCYLTVEKNSKEARTVAAIDKPDVLLQMEIALEAKKAEVATAKADKKRAELNLARAKLDNEDTTELVKIAEQAKKDFEDAEAERLEIAKQIQRCRDKAKRDTDWVAYSKKVEDLAEWCKAHDDYKDVAKKVLELLVV